MKIIEKIKLHTSYPVGEHIRDNYPIIQDMAKQINAVAGRKSINLFCQGSSGAIIAGIITSLLPKRNIIIYHIKKEKEDSHNDVINHEVRQNAFNVIVDDFVATGETINRVYSIAIRKVDNIHCLCVSGEVSERNIEDMKLDYLICSTYSIS
jgi:orotate phosphoribosyltransferase-like protein